MLDESDRAPGNRNQTKISMKLIDIGINLTHRSFESDREAVLRRAREAGVTTLILTGTSVKGSREALRLARQHPHTLFSTAGVHPHDARHCTDETIEILRKLAESSEVVAIGECGLDYNRDFSPRPDQNRWFEAQIKLASEVKKPLFLHERDAHTAFVQILKPYRDQLTAGVVHCFTGTEAELKAYLDLDLHIGITGWICDERRGQHLQKLVKLVPLNRLMVETDAPFLIPRNLHPKPKDTRNEPAYLPHIVRTIARCLGKTPEEVAAETTATATAFFQLS